MNWTAPEVERTAGSTTAAEVDMLRGYLTWHRDTFLHKCAGLTGEQLARRPLTRSSLSLLGLMRHLAKVERTWFRIRFAGQDIPPLFAPDTPDLDFNELDPARAAEAYQQLLDERALADAAIAGASLDDTMRFRNADYSLRLIYHHVITEYARHNGHADLLREYTDGVTGP